MKTKISKKAILFLSIDIAIAILLFAFFQNVGLKIFIRLNWAFYILLLLKLFKDLGLFSYLTFIIGRYSPMIIVPGIALAIFFIILKYYETSTPLTKTDLISFYGDYLSFIGAFCLGYFIYRRNESSKIDDKISKCKLLLNCLESTDLEMLRIARYNYRPAFINYDSNWINYFYEYESLIHSSDIDLKITLTKHFNTIDKMNIAIAKNNYKLASEIFEESIVSDCYLIAKYNQLEAKLRITDACRFKQFGFKSFSQNWLDVPETKRIISEYSKAYYPLIEMYVWNHMIKNNLQYTTDQKLDREITDWLLTNEEFKKIAKFPPDKRIVSKIVCECFLMIEKKSQRLSYCWGDFSLKNLESI